MSRSAGRRATPAGARFAGVLPAVLVAAALAGCSPSVERLEVARVPSPDAALDAVVEQSAAGATTSPGYLVSLPRHGCAAGPPVLRVVGATRSAAAYGVDVHWRDGRTISVDYLDARTADPATGSFPVSTDVGPVEVDVRPGVADPSAPPGTMPIRTGPPPIC